MIQWAAGQLPVPGLPPGAFIGLCGIREGGLPEHRSEHQAPRRTKPTTVPDANAEPPSERSVFGEHARRTNAYVSRRGFAYCSTGTGTGRGDSAGRLVRARPATPPASELR